MSFEPGQEESQVLLKKWRIVVNNNLYQLEKHWPVPKLRSVNTDRRKNTPTFYTPLND
jgi:hypothetical protein